MSEVYDFKRDLLQHLPALRGYARMLCGNSALADDMTQEALLRAWAHKTKFAPGTNMRAWLFTILRNVFYTQVRRQTQDSAVCNELRQQQDAMAPSQHLGVEVKELLRILPRLPAEQREAMFLVIAEGLTYERAAAICGCAIGTIKSRIARGRAALHREFEGRFSQSDSLGERKNLRPVATSSSRGAEMRAKRAGERWRATDDAPTQSSRRSDAVPSVAVMGRETPEN